MHDRSIVYQNVDNPWLFIKVHHIFSSPPVLNTVIAGGQIIGTARNTADESSFGSSVEFIDSNRQLKMMSIFELYANRVINNSSPGLIVNGQIDRSIVIRPDDYHWAGVERSNTRFNDKHRPHFVNQALQQANNINTLPDISHIPRNERCLGHTPTRVAGVFPKALADNYVMHVSALANYFQLPTGVTARRCSQLGLKAIDNDNPDYCNVQEHRSTDIVDIR